MMNKNEKKRGVFKPANRRVWPHEDRTANILASHGHYIEFLSESRISSADILLDGVLYEMKSPRSSNTNSMEQLIKDALYKKQCPNIIFDSLRLKNVRDEKVVEFLISQVKTRKKIKNMLFVNKHHELIDIFTLIW